MFKLVKKIRLQSWKTIVRNLLIILFSYMVVTGFVLYFYVYFSPNFKKDFFDFSKYRISITSGAGYMGETAMAFRLQEEADKLGWQSYIFFYPPLLDIFPVLNWPIYTINWGLNFLFPSEFNFMLTNLVVIPPPHPRYLFISIAPEDIIGQNNQFIDAAGEYDGYVDINQLSPTIYNPNWINDVLQKNGKPKVPVIGFVVPVGKNIYQPIIPKKMIVFGGRLGAPRNSARYRKFFDLLAKDGNTVFYGPEKTWAYLGDAYKEVLPVDGKDLLEKISEAGIGLAIHSQMHLSAAIPTTRILEIVSAGAVAISDDNEFIRQAFGDNVLYFDQSKSAEVMAEQVENHIKWIIAHPQAAEQMARNAHQIFLDNFTADKLLLDLQEMNEQEKINR